MDIQLDDPFDDTNIRFVRRIQETEVREALKKTKESKVMGLYGIPISVLNSQICAQPVRVYRAIANGVAEASWLRQLLAELHSPLTRSTLVYCDNVSVVYLSTNPVQHQRTKHVEIDLHFVGDQVAIIDVRVLHIPTTTHFADIFTKGLPSSTFSEFRSSLNISNGWS